MTPGAELRSLAEPQSGFGRNNDGHTPSGAARRHKRHYRIIDFKRDKTGGPAAVTPSIRPEPPATSRSSPNSTARRTSLAQGSKSEDLDGRPRGRHPSRQRPAHPQHPLGTQCTTRDAPARAGDGRSAGALGRSSPRRRLRASASPRAKSEASPSSACDRRKGRQRRARKVSYGKAPANALARRAAAVRGVREHVDHPHGGGEGRTPAGATVTHGAAHTRYKTRRTAHAQT